MTTPVICAAPGGLGRKAALCLRVAVSRRMAHVPAIAAVRAHAQARRCIRVLFSLGVGAARLMLARRWCAEARRRIRVLFSLRVGAAACARGWAGGGMCGWRAAARRWDARRARGRCSYLRDGPIPVLVRGAGAGAGAGGGAADTEPGLPVRGLLAGRAVHTLGLVRRQDTVPI